MKEVVCYAAALGGCSAVQSDEHYISRGIFASKILTIEGQSWLQGQSKTLNIEKVGLPILCDRHNKCLSPIDAFAKDFAAQLDQLTQLMTERQSLKRGLVKPKTVHRVKAFMLEQWMIKCAVGAMFENVNLKWHPDNGLAVKPPIKILRALFGYEKLRPPMGLYSLVAQGDLIEVMESSAVAHLHHPLTDGYVGALINFRNHKFLIWLSEESLENYSFPVAQDFSGKRITLFGPEYNQPMYHPEKINFVVKGMLIGNIVFDWNYETEILDKR